MKKTIIKGAIVILVFFTALFVISGIMNKGNTDMTAQMADATLPVISVNYGGHEINKMFGYREAMETSQMRESITPLASGRKINLVINPYQNRINEIVYELRSVDGSRLIENTEIREFEQAEDKIEVSFGLKDLIESNREYLLVVVLTLENGEEIRYYTRVIYPEEYYVIDKLDYLKDLGVEVLYLNPIFISPSNHKYDTADFDHVDPHFGVIVNDEGELLKKEDADNSKATRFIKRVSDSENLAASDALFAKLTEEAHKRGMKVILDGVFNHCGSFNKWMDAERIYENAEGYEKGAYVSEDSPYHDYFIWKDGGKWPYNGNYEAWWDYETLPKLNYNSKALYDYICRIGAKWVSAPYNADGWRLDVAADLGSDSETNHRFWADFRKSVKEANPNAIILAEHYGDASAWLQGKEWDTVMNYDAFMEPLTWFLTGMEKHSDEYKEELVADKDAFWKSMKEYSARFSTPSLLTAMNELSNHDHSRFLTRTTRKVGRVEELGSEAAGEGISTAVMREAVTVQMTWPGAPTLYYGDEVGVCGFTDPDNRRVYPWGSEDKEMLAFHKAIIALHRKRKELRTGSLIPLSSPIGVIAYGRKLGKKATLTLVNNMPVDMEVKLPVWMLGNGVGKKYIQRLITDSEGYNTGRRTCRDKDGILTIVVPKTGGIVLCN